MIAGKSGDHNLLSIEISEGVIQLAIRDGATRADYGYPEFKSGSRLCTRLLLVRGRSHGALPQTVAQHGFVLRRPGPHSKFDC